MYVQLKWPTSTSQFIINRYVHGSPRPQDRERKGSINVMIHLHNASTTMLILNDYSDFINTMYKRKQSHRPNYKFDRLRKDLTMLLFQTIEQHSFMVLHWYVHINRWVSVKQRLLHKMAPNHITFLFYDGFHFSSWHCLPKLWVCFDFRRILYGLYMYVQSLLHNVLQIKFDNF